MNDNLLLITPLTTDDIDKKNNFNINCPFNISPMCELLYKKLVGNKQPFM